MHRTAFLRSWLVIVVCCVAVGSSHGSDEKQSTTVTVFAAASTTDALTEAAAAYMKVHAEIRVACSFGSSAMLAKQIEQGAPCAIYLSADLAWMDELEKGGLIVDGTRRQRFANRLALIAPINTKTAVNVTKDFAIADAFTGRLAIADPASVPAGRYAKQAFIALGWWDALQSRLAPAADVRAALRLVEIGECELGVVYTTDAAASDKVRTVAAIPEALHTPIRYPLALVKPATPAATALLAWLCGDEAAAFFTRRGFSAVDEVVAAPPTAPTPSAQP